MRRRGLGRLALGLVGASVLGAKTEGSPACLLVSDPLFLEHRGEAYHPERPERLQAILQALAPVPGLRRAGPRPATDAELGLVHTAAHVARIRDLAAGGGGAIDGDTYVGPRSFEVTRAAVGALLVAVFQPEFTLVSAGFDAYRDDPIGGLGYEVDDYRRLMEAVVGTTPPGRVVSALEGGYRLDALGPCVLAHLAPLLRGTS